MNIKIQQEKLEFLDQYMKIPISFEVNSVYTIIPDTTEFFAFELQERKINKPYIKNFDENISETPLSWGEKWDISNWGLFSAREGETLVGVSAIAWNTNSCNMLKGRTDICVLWDIRVHPDHRRKGIGSKLFETAVKFGKERACKFLKIEAQNNNVSACRFYKKMGCHIGAFDMYAYEKYPEETMLIWYFDLTLN